MKIMKILGGFELFSVYSDIYETYMVVLQFEKIDRSGFFGLSFPAKVTFHGETSRGSSRLY